MRITTALVSYFLICFFFLCLSDGATLNYIFVLKNTNFTRLNRTKSMLTVNDSFPGPEIHVHKGDTVFVTIYNHGTFGVTIHWHGVRQPRNPWSDGPENITQCPIPVGENFTQEIDFSHEEGTLWWHAHNDWSRATVHGAIIVLPINGTYPFAKPDDEKTIVLASWYNSDVMEIIPEATTKGFSDAFTINGQPGDLYDNYSNSTYSMVVTYGKTYLLRIINAVLNEEMFFGIANHSITIVGQDGWYINPVTVPWLMITPGQTMDVLFTANSTPGYYYMAAKAFMDLTAITIYDNTTTTGIIQYSGNVMRPNSIPIPPLPARDDSDAAYDFFTQIKGLVTNQVPTNITKKVIMAVSLNTIPCLKNTTIPCAGFNGDIQSASLNNFSFVIPKVNVLQAYYKNLTEIYTSDLPLFPTEFYNFTGNLVDFNVYTKLGTRIIEVEYGQGVEFVFQGTNIVSSAMNHPLHLHGYNLYLVGKGKWNFDSEKDPPNYNLVNPPLVNTIGVPKNGWVAVRFVADNPGVWFMHCHLEAHVTWGMATVVIVKNGPTNVTSMRDPPAYMPPCSP